MATDVPGIDNRWKLFDTSPALVETSFKEAQEYAKDAYTSCMEALDRLEAIGLQLSLINRAIGLDTTPITTPSLPDRGDGPDIDLNLFRMDLGQVPQEPTNMIGVTIDSFPEFPDLVTGTVTPPNETYVSALLTAIKEKLLNDLVTGNVGIPDTVQEAMFKRESERAFLEHQDNLDRIRADWSAGGWPVPTGPLMAALDKAETDFTNKRLDVSRDIAIKSFELAVQNMHFVIQYGIQLEMHLMGWAHGVATLALEASKAIVLMDIEAFKAKSDGARAKIQGIVEKCKAQIEYNRGIIDAYLGRVNAYSSRVKAESDRVGAVARGYEAQVNVLQALTNLDISKVGVDLKVLDMKLQQAMNNANILIKDKDIAARNQEVIANLKVEAVKAAGSIAAQLVAGAMSAVHAQVGISAGDSASYNFNTSVKDQAAD